MSEFNELDSLDFERPRTPLARPEVQAPRPYTDNPVQGEVYTFPVPPLPVPEWVRQRVQRVAERLAQKQAPEE